MLTFIRNDQRSFNCNSRVYDVYDETNELLTQIVIGYDSEIVKYFICYYSLQNFYDANERYPERNITFWSELINDFIFVFENLFDKADLVQSPRSYNFSELPELKRENLYYWIGSCYYDTDEDLPQSVDEEEWYIDELLQQECLIPMVYEYDCKYKDYDPCEFRDDYYEQEEAADGILCEIDYDKTLRLADDIKAATSYNQ